MIRRAIENRLRYFVAKYPIVTLTGPRQSGKSTLLKNCFPDYKYVSFEDPDMLLLAKEDTRLFLHQYSDRTILDEVQRYPGLFSYLQSAVDNVGRMGMYILSGSHNFLLMEAVTQSLAGRTAVLKLLPFSHSEIKGLPLYTQSIDWLIHTGGYPRIYDKNLAPKDFYPFYIQTYVERDVRLLQSISNMDQFVKFTRLCAGRIGQLLNLSSLANECGISQPTARAWLSVLEASYIVYLLKPYYQNFNKRLVKTPKLYFYDTGLACSLLGIKDESQIFAHYLRGELFENWVISEYIKAKYNSVDEPSIYFWRDNVGNEIDLLVEEGANLSVFEIKSGSTYNDNYFKGKNFWRRIAPHVGNTLSVVYGGDRTLETKHGLLLAWNDWCKV
jgi:hypothetical protein